MKRFLTWFFSLFSALFGFLHSKKAIEVKPSYSTKENTETANRDLLTEVWEEREEVVYKSFFENMPEQIYKPIDPQKVAVGGVKLLLSCAGVFEIAPTEHKKYWTYITSGLSNPVDSMVREISGFGFELILRTSERSVWAVNQLFNLMGYVLETKRTFAKGHRMPLNAPLNSSDSQCVLKTLLFWPPHDISSEFQLKSGKVQLLEVIGITDAEYLFAKTHSSQDLYNQLQKLPSFPITQLRRSACL
jgi:hypothetical protein